MTEETLKVGTLARRTGLSVRALHHYDEIGLLSPTARTRSGHRLYGLAEVRRLQQIASLRQLGLTLSDIKDCLDRPEFALEHVISLQIERTSEEVERLQRLRRDLEGLRERLGRDEEVTIDDIVDTIQETTAFERYFTPDQLTYLARRRERTDPARMEEVQREWQALFDEYGRAMQEGLAPDSDTALALARRSAALVEEFTGGDEGVRAGLTEMYGGGDGADLLRRRGMSVDPALWEYMAAAGEAHRKRHG
jgi:DNA-binding transcriptional MerR regulator